MRSATTLRLDCPAIPRPLVSRRRAVAGWLRSETTKAKLTAMATTNDLKNGMVLNLDGQLWSVIWFQHHKPGKGGAVVRTKLKNVLSGKVVDKTFNADVRVETANVDKRSDDVPLQRRRVVRLHGHRDVRADAPHARHRRRGERTSCSRTKTPSSRCTTATPLYIELPASVELLIEYTEPGLQGDRSTGGTKPARLETGYEIAVPLFITSGEKVKVDTRDGSYLGRVSS